MRHHAGPSTMDGYEVSRHLDFDKPPGSTIPFRLEMRATRIKVRIRDRRTPQDGNRDQTGHFVADPEDYGDVFSELFWLRDRRVLSMFGTAWSGKTGAPKNGVPPTLTGGPVPIAAPIKAGKDKTFGHAQKFYARPVKGRKVDPTQPPQNQDAWHVSHSEFAWLGFSVPRASHEIIPTGPEVWPWPPQNYYGLFTPSQIEGNQVENWHPTDPRIVAPFRAGTRDYGTIVTELKDAGDGSGIPDCDTDKMGRVHDQWVEACDGLGRGPNRVRYVNCWQLVPSIDQTGSGLIYAEPVGQTLPGDGSVVPGAGAAQRKYAVNYASSRLHGPLSAGARDDKHRVRCNSEGEPVQPLHLDLDAILINELNVAEDGPLHHTRWVPGRDRQQPTIVRFGYNPGAIDPKSGLPGCFDWWTTTPILSPIPPTRIPIPGDGVPGIPGLPGRIGPRPRPGRPVGGGPGGGGGGRDPGGGGDGDLGGAFPLPPGARNDLLPVPGGPQPLQPDPLPGVDRVAFGVGEPLRSEGRLDPGRYDYELSVRSLHIGHTRAKTVEPDDGRFDESRTPPVRPDAATIVGRVALNGTYPNVAPDYLGRPLEWWKRGTPSQSAMLIVPPGYLPDGPDDQSAFVGGLDAGLYGGSRWCRGGLHETNGKLVSGVVSTLDTYADRFGETHYGLDSSGDTTNTHVKKVQGVNAGRFVGYHDFQSWAPASGSTTNLTITSSLIEVDISAGNATLRSMSDVSSGDAGVQGIVELVIVAGANTLTIEHQGAGATETDFYFASLMDGSYTLGDVIRVVYSPTLDAWVVL